MRRSSWGEIRVTKTPGREECVFPRYFRSQRENLKRFWLPHSVLVSKKSELFIPMVGWRTEVSIEVPSNKPLFSQAARMKARDS